MFTCAVCNEEMIYGGDEMHFDADNRPLITSNHTCPKCDAFLEYSTYEETEEWH